VSSFDRILVGVDFSASSVSALGQALRIAEWSGASVRVFHVTSSLSERLLPSDSETRLERLLQDVGARHVESHDVITGRLLPETLALVDSWSPDLLVIGAYGPLGQFTGSGVGTFTMQCMRHAPCRVLAVHEQHVGRFERILACVDFSEASDGALEAAAECARRDSGQLHVLHVRSDGETPEDVERLLEGKLEAMNAAGAVEARFMVVDAPDAGRAIVQQARDVEAQLISFGSTGRGQLEYLLVGSTAEKVLKAGRQSVLVTKPMGFASPGRRR
jgi:nucleotide-binding universal stress UspA family protein